ncbi:MAG: hypothetical protein JRF24_11180 [Deltaproteobacteria bacterium]|nr:hypothetical protein [Deltaproteobacteria bacterium]
MNNTLKSNCPIPMLRDYSSLRSILSSLTAPDFLLPIVHAEADYKGGLCLGDEFDIFLKSEVGDSSFVLSYSFKDSDGNVSAEIKTVHVSVNKETKKKIPLSEKLRKGLLTIS